MLSFGKDEATLMEEDNPFRGLESQCPPVGVINPQNLNPGFCTRTLESAGTVCVPNNHSVSLLLLDKHEHLLGQF